LNNLQKRYDVLFEMYVEHIHEHRLGVGVTCFDCVDLANRQIERRLEKDYCPSCELGLCPDGRGGFIPCTICGRKQ